MYWNRVALRVATGVLLPSVSLAQPITVVNFSFESPVLSPAGYTTTAPPGWTHVAAGGGTPGAFYPTVASWGYVASHGNQVLYLNSAAAEQTTAALAQSGQTYTLQVDVINRPGFGGNPYYIELYAGATLLARDNNSLLPPSAGFLVSTLSHTVTPGSPAIGQPLRIRLGGATQTNFDNVRLFLGPPGPSTCYANCDASTVTPILNVNDFICFSNRFAAGQTYANCDSSTAAPILNVNDFICFSNRFAAGCQ